MDIEKRPVSFKLLNYQKVGIRALAAEADRSQGSTIADACGLVDRFSFVASQQFAVDRFSPGYRSRITQLVLDLDPGRIDPASELGHALKALAEEQRREAEQQDG